MSDNARNSAHTHGHGLTFDTQRLGTSLGTIADWRDTVVLSEDIGVEMVKVPAGREVELDLTVSRVEDGVYVSGTASAEAVAECVRCLTELGRDATVTLGDLYAEPGSPSAEAAEEEEVRLLDDGRVDLTQALIDGFGLSFELAPTCESVTGKPCPDNDVPAPDGNAEDWEEKIDPRWAGLAEKFGRDPETGEEK